VEYFCYAPGFYLEAGEWFVKKGVKVVGIDTQALDHTLGTREVWCQGEGEERNRVLPWLADENIKRKREETCRGFPVVGTVP